MASRSIYLDQSADSRRTRRPARDRRCTAMIEQLERRLCMDAAAAADDGQLLLSPVHAAALVARPRSDAPIGIHPQMSLAGPSKPVGRGGDAEFTVSLSSAPGEGQGVSVHYKTVDGAARAGRQYVATSGVLEFSGDEKVKTIYVHTTPGSASRTLKPDNFTLVLSSPAGVKLTKSSAIATIAPSVPGLGISSTSLDEGNSGTKTATFVVSLGRPSSKIVTVDYATADGTAKVADNDYVATSGSLTFAPGETAKTISVLVNGDTTPEIKETFSIVLSNAVNAPLQRSTGTAEIRTDDGLPEIIHGFQITLDYSTTLAGPVPKAVRDAAEWAAARWQDVILGDLPDVNDPNVGYVDDFRMTVGMGLLGDADGTDGTSSTLANAKPLQFRSDSTRLPWLGITGIDPADAYRPELRAILLHEFGHALGFTPGADVFSQYAVTTGTGTGTGKGFIGTHAVQAYREIFGNTATSVPLETAYGTGTAGSHWSEAVFGPELMTGIVDPVMQLSRITIGAFEDFGYQVNYAAADRYIPPPAGLLGGGQSAGSTSGAAGLQSAAIRSAFAGNTAANEAGLARAPSIVAFRHAVTNIVAQAAGTADAHQGAAEQSPKRFVPPAGTARTAAIARAVFGSWRSDRVTSSLS